MQRNLLICLLIVAAPAAAAGQSLKPGTHVRVSTYGHPLLEGTLRSVTVDSIAVDTVRLPINAISELQVRHRRGNAGRGALIGGVTLGSLSGIAMAAGCAGSSGSFIDCSDQVPAAFLSGALLGFVSGAAIGAVIGAIAKSDRWEEVPIDRLSVSVVPQRDGRFTLGLSVAF